MNRAILTLTGALLSIYSEPGAGQALRVPSAGDPISVQAPRSLSMSQRLDSARARLGRSDLAMTALGKVLKVSPSAPQSGEHFVLTGYLVHVNPSYIQLAAARDSKMYLKIGKELLPHPALLDCAFKLQKYTAMTVEGEFGALKAFVGPGEHHFILVVGTNPSLGGIGVSFSVDHPKPHEPVRFFYCELTPIKT